MIRTFMEVYRPHALMVCSYSKGGAAMSFVPAFDPNRKAGRVPKGTKVYNYDNQVYFTLSIEEAILTTTLIKTLIEHGEDSFTQGVELRPTTFYIVKDEYGIHINIKHFDPQTNKPSTFVVTRSKNGQYKVGIMDSVSGQNIFLNLDILEISAFMKYLENTATFLATQIALTKFEAYKNQERQRRNQQNNGANQYTTTYKSSNQPQGTNFYGSGIPQQQPSQQQSPQTQVPPPPPTQQPSNNQQANMFIPPPPSDD